MSLKKPIIIVTKKCPDCKGTGKVFINSTEYTSCPSCGRHGKIDVRQNDPQFKKYYIKNLEEVIDYWTRLYRSKRDEAQEYLKKVREYCKELDKVVNKEKENAKKR